MERASFIFERVGIREVGETLEELWLRRYGYNAEMGLEPALDPVGFSRYVPMLRLLACCALVRMNNVQWLADSDPVLLTCFYEDS